VRALVFFVGRTDCRFAGARCHMRRKRGRSALPLGSSKVAIRYARLMKQMPAMPTGDRSQNELAESFRALNDPNENFRTAMVAFTGSTNSRSLGYVDLAQNSSPAAWHHCPPVPEDRTVDRRHAGMRELSAPCQIHPSPVSDPK
jgi:hypothetical protein